MQTKVVPRDEYNFWDTIMINGSDVTLHNNEVGYPAIHECY